MRKVVAAWQELDRDNIVFRTAQGREAKRLTTKDRMQTGKVKVNGSKNYLQRLKPNPKQVHQILTAGKEYDRGAIGLRPLAARIGAILKTPSLSHETARRVLAEIRCKGTVGI